MQGQAGGRRVKQGQSKYKMEQGRDKQGEEEKGGRRKIQTLQRKFRDKQRQEGRTNLEGRGNQGQYRDIIQKTNRNE